MKFSAAVRRLGLVAESLTEALAFDVHIITDAYMFGELLDGPESVEVVSVAFVVEFPVLQPAFEPPSAAMTRRRLNRGEIRRVSHTQHSARLV